MEKTDGCCICTLQHHVAKLLIGALSYVYITTRKSVAINFYRKSTGRIVSSDSFAIYRYFEKLTCNPALKVQITASSYCIFFPCLQTNR